jgi:hypothetical protein
VAERLNEDLIGHDAMLWSACRTRKEHKCHECGMALGKGTRVFRPITEGYRRMQRICTLCVRTLCGEWKGTDGKPSTPRQRRGAKRRA